MSSASNRAGRTALPWLVIREDSNGSRYRVGRYATREEAQRIGDGLNSRGHQQLYSVGKLLGKVPPPSHDLVRGYVQEATEATEARKNQLEPTLEEPAPPAPLPEAPATATATDDEPATEPRDFTERRLRRVRPLFEALAHILPADTRGRWAEEWTAEWIDLGESPLRTRVAFLIRVTLRGLPSIAWTLRFAARRQRAR